MIKFALYESKKLNFLKHAMKIIHPIYIKPIHIM